MFKAFGPSDPIDAKGAGSGTFRASQGLCSFHK